MSNNYYQTDSWFKRLFGVEENEDYEKCKQCFKVEGNKLTSIENNKTYIIGEFTTPSLSELREKGKDFVGKLTGTLAVEVQDGDVANFHGDLSNKHSLFQAASQFNCLEFPTSTVAPEDGVTDYSSDRTQGPACAIACGPGTVYRNYFVEVKTADGAAQAGQTRECQIENLRDINKAIGNENDAHFKVSGGYTLASDDQLQGLNEKLEKMSDDEVDGVRSKLRIGVHKDVQVTSTNWGKREVKGQHLVTQVYGSACSVSYSGNSMALWKPFAKLILQSSYEATLWAALINACEHKEDKSARNVYLTCLGGGVFGNDIEWIADAMKFAFEKFSKTDLQITIVTYGYVEKTIKDLVESYPSPVIGNPITTTTTTTTTTTSVAAIVPTPASTTSALSQLAKNELEFFNQTIAKPYSEQAMAFINIYWDHINQQNEFIYGVSWKKFCENDMSSQNIPLKEDYKYVEGSKLSLDDSQNFLQSVREYLKDNKNEQFAAQRYKASHPPTEANSLTSPTSFLEYLLYQYSEFANVKEFCEKSVNGGVRFTNEDIDEALKFRKELKQTIKAYEEAKAKKNDQAETLLTALGKTKDSIRTVQEKHGAKKLPKGFLFYGTLWWMDKDWEMKQARYGENN